MPHARRIVVKPARDGSAYWVDQSANGQIFSTSETYSRLTDAVRAAEDAHPELPIVIAPGEPKFIEPEDAA